MSLADAEAREDVGEEVVGGDGAGDLAEVGDGLTDVEGREVGGEAVGQDRPGSPQGFGGVCQCLGVAGIGHYQLAVGVVGGGGYLRKAFLQ